MSVAALQTPPITSADELFGTHQRFLSENVTPEALETLRANLPARRGEGDWANEAPFFVVHNLLKPESLRSLGSLAFEAGRCTTAEEHPVAGPLIRFMGDLSTFNVIEHPLSAEAKHSVKQLSNTPHTPDSLQTLVPPHQDHGDGHATIFNWDVHGPAHYFGAAMAEKPAPIEDNSLTVVLGNYVDIPELRYHGTDVHKVYTDVSPNDPAYLEIGRNRIIVYREGEDTGYSGDFDPVAHAAEVFGKRRTAEAEAAASAWRRAASMATASD